MTTAAPPGRESRPPTGWSASNRSWWAPTPSRSRCGPIPTKIYSPRCIRSSSCEELLHQIQRILHDRVVFAPIWENAFIRGVGPRVEEPGLSLIAAFPYSAPLEELMLKRP